MRTVLTLVVALSVSGLVGLESNAEPQRHARKYVPHSLPYAGRGRKRADPNSWYPHETNKLPIGTREWFDQMLRENRRNPG
jgi:hypothetical protein